MFAPLHLDSINGGLWFFKYCPNVFQSRRFCSSYRLTVGGSGGAGADGGEKFFETELIVVLDTSNMASCGNCVCFVGELFLVLGGSQPNYIYIGCE
ncbi:hypothetical protein RND71_033784 [Anisodus tanguticus]|uniref:Uncharacterized protein n=1 Tax=Anisodus tanguticus TaxID=243964 RepID=A0AAE1R978_9SOLA|nr:hypothetical protein RND71_033784 [Anisodus tanguticus]